MTENPSLELLLSRALEFDTAEERSGFLDLACRGDGGLRREVESLVEAHLAADTFLQPRVVPDREPPAENPGDRIGRYKLCEMIGEGGFGRVWMAEQQEPVRRMVALKIVKLGMDKLAQNRTWEARVSQAAALRWSGKPQRRFQALDAIREAAAMTSEREVPGNMKRLRESMKAQLEADRNKAEAPAEADMAKVDALDD